MFAASMKGIHERFDSVDHALEELLAAKPSGKSKVIEMNLLMKGR